MADFLKENFLSLRNNLRKNISITNEEIELLKSVLPKK